MKKLLQALLCLGLPLCVSAQVVPAFNLQIVGSSRDLKNTQGDALGFNIPAWPVLVKSGGVFEFASGSTLKVDAGAVVTGITANAGGTIGQVQYNNAGALGGTTALWNGVNFTGLANPVNSSDAATKAYVDSAGAAITIRTPVNIATTANITLSGEQTIDGVLTSTSRVLVKNQTLSQNNGIYTSGSGAWSRATDSNTAATLAKGYYYFVSSGTANGASSWTITTAPVVLNTDPVLFSQFSASQAYTAGTGLSLTGSTFSVNAAQPGITSLGALTGLSASGTIIFGLGGTGTTAETPVMNGGSGAGAGSGVAFYTNSVARGFIGTSNALGGLGNDLIMYGYGTNHVVMYPGTTLVGDWSAAGLAITGTLSTTGAATVGGTLASSGEFKSQFGIFSGAISSYDSSTGGIYMGYAAGSAVIRSVADNSGSYAPLAIQLGNGTQAANFTSTGLALTGSYSVDSNAHVVTTKNNFHVIINIRDYGAAGDGVTNDTAAINSAIAAMTNYSTLYIPKGRYLVTLGGITAFTTLNNITIMGDGISSQLYSSATGSAGSTYFLFLSAGCDHITLKDFSLFGSATARGSGGHGIICYASYSTISGIYITGTSDFGIYVSNGAGAYSHSVTVERCISDHTLGDGFHFGAVTDVTFANCQSYYTGDDGCGIGDDGAIGFPATRVEVVGFQSIQAGNHAGGGTHGAGIRIFDGAVDVHVTGGSMYQSCEAGITCGRFSSTTAYNTRIKIDGVKVYQCLQNVGMYGQINFQFVNQGSITGCWSEAPQSQGCYAFLDCNNLVVSGNTAKDAVLRAFVTDDATTTNVATTWSNWTFTSNVCLGNPSNESYYFIPATGKTITNLLLIGNTETGQSATNYINTNRLAGTCKIITNCSLGGKTITNGGSGISPTATPNY